MNGVVFSSVLPKQYHEEFEALLFFNPQQNRWREKILESIRRFGAPKIVTEGNRLRVVVGDHPDVQTLFALGTDSIPAPLLGSILYLRDTPANLTVLHIAVTPHCLMSQHPETVPLAVQLFNQVREVARKVKGIETVTVLYGNGQSLRVPA